MEARDRLLAQFEGLSPAMQAAARFIVDHPDEVVIGSMRSLAERAGIQPATLVRLAQQLGYGGWPGLKSAFAEDFGLRSGTYGEKARSLARRGKAADLTSELFAVQRANLDATEVGAAPRLRETARLLKRARAVHIAGFRASHPLAFSLFYGYRLFRNSVFLVNSSAAGLEAQMRAIEKGDAVVAISFAPYSRESLVVARHAREVGATLIALTDSNASPLAREAQEVLVFSVSSPSFFPSIAAGMAVTEALLEQLVADGGESVVTRIDEVEKMLFEAGSYVQRPGRRGSGA